MSRFASIDLGTNTCNLLVADYTNNQLNVVASEKRAVKLLKNAPDLNSISQEGRIRCMEAVEEYQKLITIYQPEIVLANATSGIRSASNGYELLEQIHRLTGISFTTISGDEEAQLVFKAVKNAVDLDGRDALLIDIGGGSIEFILYYNDSIAWQKSFNLGISRVLNQFHFSDPLAGNDMSKISEYFDTSLDELYHIIKMNSVKTLVGSSGTFETLANIYLQKESFANNASTTSRLILLHDFKTIYNEIIHADYKQRMAIKGMDPMRVELIPLASWFVNYLVDKIGIELIVHSRYSLKEGAIFAFIENNSL